MDTGIYTPQALFGKAICYVIPPFQRPYVWEEEHQWEPLWNDIRNTAEAYLENFANSGDRRKAEHDTPSHFLGAIVLQQELTSTGEIGQRIIVDGQQRVTTLQILLDAARRVCAEFGLDPVNRLSMLVRNDDRSYSGDELLKLWPTRLDGEAFRAVMDNATSPNTDSSSRIVDAHDFFRSVITDWIQEDDDDLAGRALALEAAITSRMQLVVIDLGIEADPHVIFETLNARGTPLLASDLIRNYSLSEARGNAAEIDEIWNGLRDEWWQSDIQQGRLRRARIEVALNYWLIMRKAKEVLASSMFNEFKNYAEQNTIEPVMRDVQYVLSQYRSFHSSDTLLPEEKEFRYRLDTMQMGVVTPIVLRLLSSESISEEQRLMSFWSIESFLIRRMVCRSTTKNYNRQIQSLLLEVEKHGVSNIYGVIIDFLRKQDADAGEWPSDAQITDALTRSALYRLLTRGRLRLILEGIESELRSSMSEQLDVPKGLTIEHIMPRSWEDNWPLPAESEDEAVERRRHLIETLGNLTLTTQRLNSSLSNAPWQRTDSNPKSPPGKRTTLSNHSVLFLNKELIQHDAWSEELIQERSKRLSEIFIRVWPGPESSEWD